MADGNGDSRITRASQYREIADSLRALAATVKNADVRDELYRIAADYERLAGYVEGGIGEPP